MVRLDCLIKLRYEAHSSSTFIFNIEPAASAHQTIVKERIEIKGQAGMCDGIINNEGTRLLRFPAIGPIEVSSHFVVDILHAVHDPSLLFEMQPKSLPMPVLPYLYPSRYCESDKLMPFARQQFGWQAPGYRRVASIAQWVREHVALEPVASPGNQSAVDVLARASGAGRDLAHLMIALCRALNVPARYVSGIDYGDDPGQGSSDFHAYVEVFLSDRWYLFDPTGIAPTTGLVRLGTGRDASEASCATALGNVTSLSAQVQVRAIEDADADIRLPVATDLPVSTTQALAA